MSKQLEHIKNWAQQDVSTFTSRFVADSIIRMCDDGIREEFQTKDSALFWLCDPCQRFIAFTWYSCPYCNTPRISGDKTQDKPAEVCQDDRHSYYKFVVGYPCCPYCGMRLSQWEPTTARSNGRMDKQKES